MIKETTWSSNKDVDTWKSKTISVKKLTRNILLSGRLPIQWGSEIRTCPDFGWSTFVRFSNGLVFKWFCRNGCHIVKTIRKPDKNFRFLNGRPFEIRTSKCPVFEGSVFGSPLQQGPKHRTLKQTFYVQVWHGGVLKQSQPNFGKQGSRLKVCPQGHYLSSVRYLSRIVVES